MSRYRLILPLCLGCFASTAAVAEIDPHRARYVLGLESVSGSNTVASASGEMTLDWTDVCDGWATDLDLRVRLFDPEGEEMRFGSAVDSWESKDGQRFRYLVKERATFLPARDLKGTASLEASGAGEAQFSEPEIRTVLLPEGTLFPTAHSLAVLAAAEAGETFFMAPLFDGSEDEADKLMTASATIVGPFQDENPRMPSLNEVPYYKISLAFYEAKESGALPSHEVRLRLYENGVVDDQLFDYGDFVLSAVLAELTYHPETEC